MLLPNSMRLVLPCIRPCFAFISIISISNHVNSFRERTAPIPEDRFEVVSADCVTNQTAVLALRAPKRLWLKDFDWVKGPYPSDIKINLCAKNQIRTPLVQRLKYHRKQQKRQLPGAYRYDALRLAQIWTIAVFEEELSNEKVQALNL